MKRTALRLLAASLTLLPVAAFTRDALAGSCTPNTNIDYCKDPDVTCVWQQATENMDDALIAQRCGAVDPQGIKVSLYGSLNLGETGNYWNSLEASDGGWCQPDGYYSRLLNGALAMANVTYATDNTTIPQTPYGWLDFVHKHTDDEGMLATCFVGPKIATFYQSKPLELHYHFFATQNPYLRGSALAHEGAHDFQKHISDSACKAKASCDTYFGASNATSFALRFDQHALQAYQRKGETKNLKVLNYGGGVCGYAPLTSPLVRLALANDIAWRLEKCFQTQVSYASEGWTAYGSNDPLHSYGGTGYEFDDLVHARWKCGKVCDDGEYAPGGKHFCSNQLQEANAAINAANQSACSEALAKIGAGVPDDEYFKISTSFYSKVKSCVPGVSQSYLDAECATAKSGSNDVAALESHWKLPDQPGYFDSGTALTECTKSFCQEKFQPGWATSAASFCYDWSGDGLGCLDTLCGSLSELSKKVGATSKEYFHALQCRRQYLASGGAPSSIHAEEQGISPCDRVYDECVDKQAYEKWLAARAAGQCGFAPSATGSPPAYQYAALDLLGTVSLDRFNAALPGYKPNVCDAAFKTCKAVQKFAASAVANAVKDAFPPIIKDGQPVGPDDYFVSKVSPTDGFSPGSSGLAIANGPALAAVAGKVGPVAFQKLFGAGGHEWLLGPSLTRTTVLDRTLPAAIGAELDLLDATRARGNAGAAKIVALEQVAFHDLMTSLENATRIEDVSLALKQAGLP